MQVDGMEWNCNNRLADGPHSAGGRSARGDAQIFIWKVVGPTRHFSLLPLFFRSSSSRAIVAPYFDLPPPPTKP